MNSLTPKEKNSQEHAAKQQETLQRIISSGKYWSVYIDYADEKTCCNEALKLKKQQLPLNSVPLIPLTGCTKNICKCTYVGLVDKRKIQQRRINDRRAGIRFEEKPDRRSHNDRR